MPHQTRTPSTQLSLCKDLFNQLVGILDFNIKMNIEDEKFSTTAEKLKNKLLTYSVPRVNNDDPVSRSFKPETCFFIKSVYILKNTCREEIRLHIFHNILYPPL